jgi:hypothetical protein
MKKFWVGCAAMYCAVLAVVLCCVCSGDGIGEAFTKKTRPFDTYKVTVLNGGYGASTWNDYEAGTTVTIDAGTKTDSVFWMWTSDTVSNVQFADSSKSRTTFTMPAMNVNVKAWWKAAIATPTYAVVIFDGIKNSELFYKEGDNVEVEAVGPFAIWIAADTALEQTDLNFANPTSRKTSFKMPAKDLLVFAYPTAVRFTWEAAEQSSIYMIMASEEDVAWWYDAVYFWQGYDDVADYIALLHMSHRPLGDGSDMIPNNIYKNEDPTNVKHKSKYYAIDEGEYTAICTVIDTLFSDTFDIVANYDIYVDEDAHMAYFEIGFDVGLFLSGEELENPDTWVLKDAFDNPATPPNLVKAKAKKTKFLKKVKKDNVTYYVFRRARK